MSSGQTAVMFASPFTGIDNLNGNTVEKSPGKTKTKRSRQLYSRRQLDLLEGCFNRSQYPDSESKAVLSKETGLSPKRIKNWFKNRRAKLRQISGESSNSRDGLTPTPSAQVAAVGSGEGGGSSEDETTPSFNGRLYSSLIDASGLNHFDQGQQHHHQLHQQQQQRQQQLQQQQEHQQQQHLQQQRQQQLQPQQPRLPVPVFHQAPPTTAPSQIWHPWESTPERRPANHTNSATDLTTSDAGHDIDGVVYDRIVNSFLAVSEPTASKPTAFYVNRESLYEFDQSHTYTNL